MSAKPESISLPAEEHAPCPQCRELAAVIDRGAGKVTTACTNCGSTIKK